MRHAVILAGLLVYSVATGATAAEFFVLSQPERAIYRINSAAPGKPIRVGSVGSEGALMALIDLGDGELMTFDGQGHAMLTFNVAQGQVTATKKLDRALDEHVRGFAKDSSGTLYGVFPGMKLATINRDTGETTPVATLSGAARIEALAFGPGDRLFASGSEGRDTKSERLYRVNLKNGKLEPIGAHGFSDVDTLTFGADTFLYGTNSRAELTNELLRLSPRGGKGEVAFDTGVPGVNGIVLIREKP
jgi:hypothetical protein